MHVLTSNVAKESRDAQRGAVRKLFTCPSQVKSTIITAQLEQVRFDFHLHLKPHTCKESWWTSAFVRGALIICFYKQANRFVPLPRTRQNSQINSNEKVNKNLLEIWHRKKNKTKKEQLPQNLHRRTSEAAPRYFWTSLCHSTLRWFRL